MQSCITLTIVNSPRCGIFIPMGFREFKVLSMTSWLPGDRGVCRRGQVPAGNALASAGAFVSRVEGFCLQARS